VVYLKTPAAARRLNVTYHRLISLIRFDKIEPPPKDSSGDYIWGDSDLDRARKALLLRGEQAQAAADRRQEGGRG
jgi:hypothetical protein